MRCHQMLPLVGHAESYVQTAAAARRSRGLGLPARLNPKFHLRSDAVKKLPLVGNAEFSVQAAAADRRSQGPGQLTRLKSTPHPRCDVVKTPTRRQCRVIVHGLGNATNQQI